MRIVIENFDRPGDRAFIRQEVGATVQPKRPVWIEADRTGIGHSPLPHTAEQAGTPGIHKQTTPPVWRRRRMERLRAMISAGKRAPVSSTKKGWHDTWGCWADPAKGGGGGGMDSQWLDATFSGGMSASDGHCRTEIISSLPTANSNPNKRVCILSLSFWG